MDAQKIIAEFQALKAKRANWDKLYQVVGEYIHQNKQNFETTPEQGDFLTGDIYDSTGTFAAHNAASTLLGMLWPSSAAQSIEITPPDDMKKLSTGLAEFYERMSDRAAQYMDDPKANLAISLDEYMLDQVVFGTSGVGSDFVEGRLMYRPYGVKELYIKEGKEGRVSELFLHFNWQIDRVAEEYGEDKLSEESRKKMEQGKGQECIELIQVIRPRKNKKAAKGKLAMAIENIVIEVGAKHTVHEGGYNEHPIPVARFRKLNYEQYGRAPSMNALPDVREANALRESIIIATEKNLDPPLGVLDDGMLGGGTIDTSARAVNVFNASGALNGKNPVFPLVTVGSLSDALARLEKLEQTIAQHFSIDRLLDMNNETRMTFGEAQIRNQIRIASLQSLFARQIAEVFTPLVERSIRLLWEHGIFGVLRGSPEEEALLLKGIEPEYIPDELVERIQRGQDVYTIRYKTQAANASRAQEYLAIVETMQIAAQGMQIDPSLALRYDLHEAAKHLGSIRGLPVGIIRQDDEFEKLRAQQAQQQQAVMALQAGEQVANIDKTAAQAENLRAA